MSLQPCLPIGKKRHNHRKKQNSTNHDDDKNFATIEDLQNIDVMDYMASVRDEANDLPNVFICPSRPLEGRDNKQQLNVDAIDGSIAACMYLTSKRSTLAGPPYPISKKWVDWTCHSFSQLRQYVSTCHKAGIGRPPNRMTVPPSKQAVLWHIFCLGQDEANGNANGYYDDDDDDSRGSMPNDDEDGLLATTNPDNGTSEWDKRTVPVNGHAPSVGLLCQLDQILSRRVLSHLIQYFMEGWEMTINRGRWIYALLARLEKPLHREECSLLYSFLKYLCQLRNNPAHHYEYLGKKDSSIINTLIVIVAIYFEQADPDQVFTYIKNQ